MHYQCSRGSATLGGGNRMPSVALSVSFGSDWGYLARHVESGGTDGERKRADNYYLKAAEHGEPPGRWLGIGAERMGLTGDVERSQMEQVYGQFCHPQTGEVLGAPPRSYADFETRLGRMLVAEPKATPERVNQLRIEASKNGRAARSYVDLTVSPEKSWSVLHTAFEAAGRHGDAEAVWESLQIGGEAMLDYMAREAGFSRAGYHGAKVGGRTSGRWVDGHDWTVSAWRHHTSRDGDPQLHIHYAVLNRVENEDGKYRTLDGQAIQGARAAGEAVFHRVAEQALMDRLGVRFVTRDDGAARAIAGVDRKLCELFSSRRRAIGGELGELVAAYTEAHGAAPNAYQTTVMAEYATLKTRNPKLTHPPSRSEMLAEWERRMSREFGKSMRTVVGEVDKDRRGNTRAPLSTEFDTSTVIAQAMAQVDRSKAVWSRHDLIGQLDRYLPDGVRGLDSRAAQALLEGLADQALAAPAVVCLTAPEAVPAPDSLRRSDGRSVYEPHTVEIYATASLLNLEERLVLIARSKGGRRLDDAKVNRYLATESPLSPEQANIARQVTTSNKRIEVLVGPAGAGKSRTVGDIAVMWQDQGGNVVGLTVSQNAADVLAGEGVEHSANLDKFGVIQERIASGRATRKELRSFRLDERSLVILDESSMMSTHQLAETVERAHRAGAKVLVTGDDRQLGAVGAGGGMRLLVREVGAHELSEVRRFNAEWEGPASLRLRSGDASVLDIYDRHGRIVEGDEEEIKEAATTAFLSDYLNGRQSMVVAGTNEAAAEMSSRIRGQLVEFGVVEADGVSLHDDTVAGIGDVIETRKNDASIADSTGHRVTNRDTYVVTKTGAKGELTVRRRLDDGSRGSEITLPASYVAGNVELAYASTANAAQGRTLDSSYLVVDETTTRSGLYVGMSRGRRDNVAFVVVERDAGDGVAQLDSNRFGVLAGVLERDDAERSATEVAADQLTASESLARLGPIWADCLSHDAEMRYSAVAKDVLTVEQRKSLDDGAPLWRLLRSAELEGHDPAALLQAAVAERELGTADSIDKVLYWRIERRIGDVGRAQGGGPDQLEQAHAVRWRPTFTERTPAPEGLNAAPGEVYGAYARQLATAMDGRRAELGEQVAREVPEWATSLGPVPDEAFDRAEWTEKAASVAAYREQYSYDSNTDAIGPAPPRGGDPDRRAAWDQAWVALGRPERNRDVARLGDGQLSNLVQAHRREEAWAPPYVGDELREAKLSARDWDYRATVDELLYPNAAATTGTRKLADDTAERVTQLEEIDAARAAWYDHTGESRGLAERAAAELERRHPPEAPDLAQEPSGAVEAHLAGSQLDTEATLARALEMAREARERIATEDHEREAEVDDRLRDYERVRAQEPQQSIDHEFGISF